jgi:hypothetical protein
MHTSSTFGVQRELALIQTGIISDPLMGSLVLGFLRVKA